MVCTVGGWGLGGVGRGGAWHGEEAERGSSLDTQLGNNDFTEIPEKTCDFLELIKEVWHLLLTKKFPVRPSLSRNLLQYVMR